MLFFGRGNPNLIAKKRDKVVFCCTDMYAEPGSESGTPPRSRKGHHSGRGELSDRKAPEHGPRTGKGHTYYFVSKLLPPPKKILLPCLAGQGGHGPQEGRAGERAAAGDGAGRGQEPAGGAGGEKNANSWFASKTRENARFLKAGL